MSPWTDPKTWLASDPLPAGELNEYLRDNLRFLHDQGPDLTPSAGLVTPTTQFHKIAGDGTAIVDNMTILAAGARLQLLFLAQTKFRHNFSGTGNLRLTGAADRTYSASDITEFVSDGALWWEASASLRMIRGRVNVDGSIESGTGFTVTFGGTGEYLISFAQNYQGVPLVLVTCIAAGARFAFIESTAVDQCVVHTCDADGTLANTHFMFLVAGI